MLCRMLSQSTRLEAKGESLHVLGKSAHARKLGSASTSLRMCIIAPKCKALVFTLRLVMAEATEVPEEDEDRPAARCLT
jgi:hypothetical protein